MSAIKAFQHLTLIVRIFPKLLDHVHLEDLRKISKRDSKQQLKDK